MVRTKIGKDNRNWNSNF